MGDARHHYSLAGTVNGWRTPHTHTTGCQGWNTVSRCYSRLAAGYSQHEDGGDLWFRTLDQTGGRTLLKVIPTGFTVMMKTVLPPVLSSPLFW